MISSLSSVSILKYNIMTNIILYFCINFFLQQAIGVLLVLTVNVRSLLTHLLFNLINLSP